MAAMNQFDILGADDNDDPSQLLAAAAAAAAAQKAEAKKPAAAPAGKGPQTGAAAKLPTKPAPPAQAGELWPPER
jgi:plasminogen activator inhibitor 1 RNA-binding protein